VIPIHIKIEFDPPAETYGRKLPEVTREAHRRAALHWHAEILPGHFTDYARFRYGHKSRSSRYLKYKRLYARLGRGVQDGGRIDLVYSGLTRRKMLRPPAVKAFPSRATLDMHAPSYVKMRPFRRNAPAMGEELVRMNANDLQAVEEVLGRAAEEGLKKINDTRRVIVG